MLGCGGPQACSLRANAHSTYGLSTGLCYADIFSGSTWRYAHTRGGNNAGKGRSSPCPGVGRERTLATWRLRRQPWSLVRHALPGGDANAEFGKRSCEMMGTCGARWHPARARAAEVWMARCVGYLACAVGRCGWFVCSEIEQWKTRSMCMRRGIRWLFTAQSDVRVSRACVRACADGSDVRVVLNADS